MSLKKSNRVFDADVNLNQECGMRVLLRHHIEYMYQLKHRDSQRKELEAQIEKHVRTLLS